MSTLVGTTFDGSFELGSCSNKEGVDGPNLHCQRLPRETKGSKAPKLQSLSRAVGHCMHMRKRSDQQVAEMGFQQQMHKHEKISLPEPSLAQTCVVEHPKLRG